MATTANSVTATNHVGATHAGHGAHVRNAKAAGDSFDVALDEIMQAASGDDDADANAIAAGAVTPPTDAKNDPAKTPKDAAADPSAIATPAKDDPDANACQPIPGAKDATTSVADPTKITAAKDTGKPTDPTKTDKDSPRHRDPEFAQAHLDSTPPVTTPVIPDTVPVLQQPAAAPTPANTQAPAQQNAIAAPVAAAAAAAATDDQADAPATDIAAASMQAAGTTAKPAKPGESKPVPASDSTKSQARASAASALADVSKAASRVFADQKAVSTPSATHLDAAKPQNNNGTTATQPQPAATQAGQTNPNTGQPAQSQQPQQAVAAAHTPQQPAQVPVGNAVAAAAATQQTSASPTSGAATQLSAQLQIAHPSATSTADTASLAFTIASKSQDGARHFDIRLDPVELGRIDVHLTVDDAGKAQAMLSVDKPQTLELLQKDSSHLERTLKDSGLDLAQNGLSFSLKGQQQQAGNSGGNANSSSRGRALAARVIAAVDSAASNVSLGQMSSNDTRLDIRV